MTFRVDDLLVTVLPEYMVESAGCPECSKCTDRTGTQSPCDPDKPNSENCPPCDPGHPLTVGVCTQSQERPGKAQAETWREEQFATLARDLELALSR